MLNTPERTISNSESRDTGNIGLKTTNEDKGNYTEN